MLSGVWGQWLGTWLGCTVPKSSRCTALCIRRRTFDGQVAGPSPTDSLTLPLSLSLPLPLWRPPPTVSRFPPKRGCSHHLSCQTVSIPPLPRFAIFLPPSLVSPKSPASTQVKLTLNRPVRSQTSRRLIPGFASACMASSDCCT